MAEGYGFTPELVQPLLTTPAQAIWLISTEGFKREIYRRRGKGGFVDTSDPERARRNHMGRGLQLADLLRDSARERGLTVLEINGTGTLDQTIALVERHFAPYLQSLTGPNEESRPSTGPAL